VTKEKFQRKYRIESNRNPNWDYSSPAKYFITICTASREHYFGEIVNFKMKLSEIGNIAYYEWLKTPELRPDMNIVLDEFCIMPNHFHAIIGWGGDQCRGRLQSASTTLKTKNTNKFGPQSKNLGAIIRGFKSSIKKYATINSINFAWQPNYHDHIIRNEEEFKRIKRYIQNNPKNWNKDELY